MIEIGISLKYDLFIIFQKEMSVVIALNLIMQHLYLLIFGKHEFCLQLCLIACI